MTELFPWEGKYVLGIKEIDDQHRMLVGMINALHDGLMSGNGREVTGTVLQSMMEYALYHFKTEEDLMQKFGFEGYTDHRDEHLTFMESIGEMAKRHGAGEYLVSLELNEFLKEWLANHILSTDRKYAPFLRSKLR
ncbi:MAG: bacteriohemerythrin [Candidatus Thermoplasmatota archaeon]|jgi:hemerythrin|nr:bacteriohemerythrin [Candidatus Thermoplasmatota archaeon]